MIIVTRLTEKTMNLSHFSLQVKAWKICAVHTIANYCNLVRQHQLTMTFVPSASGSLFVRHKGGGKNNHSIRKGSLYLINK